MKQITQKLLAGFTTAAILAVGATAAWAAVTKKFTLRSSSNTTAAITNSSSVDLLIGSTKPITGTAGEIPRRLTVQFYVTEASGTLTPAVLGSIDGTTFATLTPEVTDGGAAAGFGTVAAATSVIRVFTGLPRYVLTRCALSGTSASATYKVEGQAEY